MINMVTWCQFSTPLPLSLSLSLPAFWTFRCGNENDRPRYRYRIHFGLIVPNTLWIRYPIPLAVTHGRAGPHRWGVCRGSAHFVDSATLRFIYSTTMTFISRAMDL